MACAKCSRTGWLDGKDTAGDHGGTADPETSGRVDRITGAVLNYGDHGLNYNFGELLPGSIRGTVQAHDGGECDFDNPQLLLSGVQIDLLDARRQSDRDDDDRRERCLCVYESCARHLQGARASADALFQRR